MTGIWLTVAFLVGAVCGLVPGVLVGALVADTLSHHRHRRRRTRIDQDGSDALEAWLAGTDLAWHPNGTPFEDEVA